MSQYLQRLMDMTGLQIPSQDRDTNHVSRPTHGQSPVQEFHEEISPGSPSQTIAQNASDDTTTEMSTQKMMSPRTHGEREEGGHLPEQESDSITAGHLNEEKSIIHTGKPHLRIDSFIHDEAALQNGPDTNAKAPSSENNRTHVQSNPLPSPQGIQKISPVDSAQQNTAVSITSVIQPQRRENTKKSDRISSSVPIKVPNQPPRKDEKKSDTHASFSEVRAWVADPVLTHHNDTPSFHKNQIKASRMSETDLHHQDILGDASNGRRESPSESFEVQDVKLSIGDIHLSVEVPPQESFERVPAQRMTRQTSEQDKSENRLERHYLRL